MFLEIGNVNNFEKQNKKYFSNKLEPRSFPSFKERTSRNARRGGCIFGDLPSLVKLGLYLLLGY